jgi:hypothetical protein
MILLLALAVAYLALRWLMRQQQRAQLQVGLFLFGLAIILLAAAGRLPWVFGLAGVLLPLLAGMLGLRRQRRGRRQTGPAPSGGQSVVETRFLRMTLDHDSGEMLGHVLAGRFAGQRLDALSQGQLVTLLDDYQRDDEESAALLRAYLDRTFGPEWQEAAPNHQEFEGLSSEMTRQEAHAILGLEDGATEAEILAAHGRLIQRLHPDRGGSTFLAAKINQARDLLIGG